MGIVGSYTAKNTQLVCLISMVILGFGIAKPVHSQNDPVLLDEIILFTQEPEEIGYGETDFVAFLLEAQTVDKTGWSTLSPEEEAGLSSGVPRNFTYSSNWAHGYMFPGIAGLLTDGINNSVGFLLGAFSTDGAGSADYVHMIEHDWLCEASPFSGTTLTSIKLIVDQISYTISGGSTFVTYSAVWQFYGQESDNTACGSQQMIEAPTSPSLEDNPDLSTSIPVPLIIGIAGAGIVSSGYLLARKYYWRRLSGGKMTSEIEDTLSSIFDGEPMLFYYFLAGIHEPKEGQAVPPELFDFKDFFHPARLAILKILSENVTHTSSELRKKLGISWNDYKYALYFLEENRYLIVTNEIVDGRFQKVISLEPRTINLFNQFKEILQSFLGDNENLDQYLEKAVDIKSSLDDDLYPSHE